MMSRLLWAWVYGLTPSWQLSLLSKVRDSLLPRFGGDVEPFVLLTPTLTCLDSLVGSRHVGLDVWEQLSGRKLRTCSETRSGVPAGLGAGPERGRGTLLALQAPGSAMQTSESS